MREGRQGKGVTKEELTLTTNDGEFVVFGVVGGAKKVIVYAKRASEGRCGDGAISKLNITGDGVGGDRET